MGKDGTVKDFHELARQIEIIEMANPNRSIARARESQRRAERFASQQTAMIGQRIAAGKAVRGRSDLTKDFGVSSWSAFGLSQASNDETMNRVLMSVGTSLADWQSRVNQYYSHKPERSEKERKKEGKALDAYQKNAYTRLLAPHARKIADAYMQSCIARGIEWRLVADPYYDLKDIYVRYQGTPHERRDRNDASELIRILETYLRTNSPSFNKGKKAVSQLALHKLAVNIVRWVIENPN